MTYENASSQQGTMTAEQPARALAVEPCNFRSASQLSNESARVLTSLYESFARNVMNSLDVYLGTALEVRLSSLSQLSIDEYRGQLNPANYVLPCTLAPAGSNMLLELQSSLLFTMIDLLLGGLGSRTDTSRELTEIDEEIVLGAAGLIAAQAERLWEPIGIAVRPGTAIKPSLAHKLFSPVEKVLVVRFEVGIAGVSGELSLVFPASLGGHLVRNSKTDHTSSRSVVRFRPRRSLEERMLEASFTLTGCLPSASVPVRGLAALAAGEIFLLPVPAETPGWLTLEGRPLFSAAPVRSGNAKAVQLLAALPSSGDSDEEEW